MELTTGQAHLWLIKESSVPAHYPFNLYKTILSVEEIVKSNRFHFTRDKITFLIKRALVRCVLSYYAEDVKPADWVLESNYYGKPEISNQLPFPLYFNLSSSKGVIALAVASNAQIGVDIEYLSEDIDVLNVSESVFSSTEIAELKALSPALRLERFYDLWTLKEAFVKALSFGLSMPLDTFSFRFTTDSNIKIDLNELSAFESLRWRFWQASLSPHHKLSIAIKAEYQDSRYSFITREIVPFVGYQSLDIPVNMCSTKAH